VRLTFRRLFVVATLLVIGLFVYLRPLTLFFTARSLYLRAIGMESAFTEVGGRRIHYWTAGEGPPLVLVHGVAMRAEDWAPLFRALKQRNRIYAPDLLGYGDSAQPRDGDYSIAAQTELVRGFLDAMQLEQPDIAGVSMGGWIALKLAAEHPERVKRLVLISSAGLAFASTLTETSFSASTVEEQRRNFRLQSDLAPRFPDFILRDFVRHSRKKASIVRASMRSMLERQDLSMDGKLQRVRMPVLIIAGTADRIVPFDVALRLKREMPHATLVPLPGCSHLAIIECRAPALRALTAFTSSSTSASPRPAAALRPNRE
jgi:pimeloyl-ACP methyl ester carboxylesterase